jgi:hypothetical protein
LITIRCTARLVNASKAALVEEPPRPTAPLGEWYANVVHLPFRGRSLVVFAHNPSRLAVVAPARTLRSAVPVFRERLPRLLRRIGVPEGRIREQESAMQEVVFGRTLDRSLLGSMTDMGQLIRALAQRARIPARFDLDEVEDFLAETPSLAADLIPQYWVRERLVARTLR